MTTWNRIVTAGVIFKGVAFAPLAVIAASSPLWALVLVVVSAALTGLFSLLVNERTLRENRRLNERLASLEARQRDIAGAVGVAKRTTDDGVPPEE